MDSDEEPYCQTNVLTHPVLKNLHALLLKLTPDTLLQEDTCGFSMSVSNCWFATSIKFTDITCLSDLLFQELQVQLEPLVAGTSLVDSLVPAGRKDDQISDTEFSLKGLLLLLRCCMIILKFLKFDLSLVLEKCQFLTMVLGKLCPPNSLEIFSRHYVEASNSDRGLNQSVFHGSYAFEGNNPEPGAPITFFSAILEVFLDEFLVGQELRKHFVMTDYVSSTNEKLFVSHGSHGDIQAILELVSSHFLVSVCHESAFNRFIHSLSWSNEVDTETPELSLDAALALLSYPVVFSAPQLLQAHLILMTSRCIGIHNSTEERTLDALDQYISAFEKSINLFLGYIAKLKLYDNITGFSSCDTRGLSFNSFIRPATCDKLNHQIGKLVDYCHQRSHDLLAEAKVEFIDKSVAYIKENLHIIDEKFRVETCSVLNYIVISVLHCEVGKDPQHTDEERAQHEVCCLTAALRLMSSSLLQIVWLRRQNGCTHDTETVDHYSDCKERNFIASTFSSFRECGTNQLVPKLLFDRMGAFSERHEEKNLMLAHLANLLLYSFRRRFECLWKGCIFTMISLINLILLEDGNLDAFGPVRFDLKEATIPQSSLGKCLKGLVNRKSSVVIAINLKKIQMLHFRDHKEYRTYQDNRMDIEERNDMETENYDSGKTTGNNCNGESFFQCLPEYHANPSEWDDLVDFIDGNPEKDYSGWLKNRERFRKWSHERMAFVNYRSRKRRIANKCRKRKLFYDFEPSAAGKLRKRKKVIPGRKYQ